MERKFKYNNYQFYESDILVDYLNNQEAKGVVLEKAIGNFYKILIFTKNNSTLQHKYKITALSKENKVQLNDSKHISNSRFYNLKRTDDSALKNLENKPELSLALNIRKSIIIVMLLYFVSAILFIFNLQFVTLINYNLNKFILSILLNINFLIYFAGDLSDFFKKKGKWYNHYFFFTERSALKEILFIIGDVLKFIILILGIILSIYYIFFVKDLVISIYIICLSLFMFGTYFYNLYLKNSYLSLLIISIYLSGLFFMK